MNDFATHIMALKIAPTFKVSFLFKSENFEITIVARRENEKVTDARAPRVKYCSLKMNINTKRGQRIVAILASIPLPI